MFKPKGVKSFERCAHKTVEPVKLGNGQILAAELQCPRTEDTGTEVIVHARDLPHGMFDKTKGVEGVRITNGGEWVRDDAIFNSLSAATTHLGQEACKVVCDGCVFSKMTPLEVSNTRASAAEEELALVHSEQRRLTAQLALREAHNEVAELTAAMLNPQLPPGDL